MRRKLYISQFEDPYLQQNFLTIGDIFNQNPFLKGEWRFLTFNVLATGAAVSIPHTLPFRPSDAILLSVVGGTVSFNYNLFDATYISLNATVSASPMTIRMLIGRYSEDTVNV